MRKIVLLSVILFSLAACSSESNQSVEKADKQTSVIVKSNEKAEEVMKTSDEKMKKAQESIDTLLNDI